MSNTGTYKSPVPVQALVSNEVRLDLRAALAAAAAAQPIPADATVVASVLEFVTRRLEQLLVDGGCGAEVVRAVLSERGVDPYAAAQSARDLQASPHYLVVPTFSVAPVREHSGLYRTAIETQGVAVFDLVSILSLWDLCCISGVSPSNYFLCDLR